MIVWHLTPFNFHIFSLFYFRAESEAEGVLNEYHKEAETFVKLKSDLNMNTEDLAVRVIAEAESNVYIGLKPPAKTDYGNRKK
jgi:hypothetical protein